MDNKELDKLFQEHLGDYREHPDPQVWDRIRSDLDQKKKKSRVVPLWWRWGAAAAVLLFALFLIAPWNTTQTELPGVVNTEQKPSKKDLEDETNLQNEERFPVEKQGGKLADRESEASGTDAPGVASTPKDRVNDYVVDRDANRLNNSLAAGSRADGRDQPVEKGSTDSKPQSEISATASERSALAAADKEPPSRQTDQSAQAGIPLVVDQEVATQENPEEKAAGEKKSIFEAIEEANEVAEVEEEDEKWSLGPSIAPVYFNSFGDGSPIASNFVDNSKSGTMNMSYGLQVSYKVSKKLRIRSGVHRVDYGYNTEQVGFTSSPTARPSSLIRTISYSEESKSLVVQSMVNDPTPMEPSSADVSAPSPARQGQMVQEFGYLEVPLEMQFSLIDKKFGMDLIGGMSSLFLIDNSVSLESSGTVTEIGEATNMNSLNFSTNFGLGFFYRLNSSFELNLQPMFKYQLNTFSQTSGNFNPYSIGIYSGLNFRF